MTLSEILALEDNTEKINKLKKARITPLPNVPQIRKDLDPKMHDVMNPEIRKDEIRIIEEEEMDNSGNVIKQGRTDKVPVNRIAIPLEQDIVNIHTAFTVGTAPNVECEPQTEDEQALFKGVKTIERKSKLKYQNRKIVRAWLSETEVCEYWYATPNLTNPQVPPKLRNVIWTPLKGDILYPFFDNSGDFLGCGREYRVTEDNNKLTTFFMFVGNGAVYLWKRNSQEWVNVDGYPFSHGFSKEPILYAYRPKTLTEDIRAIRNRIEVLHSNYADCIDYNFAPKLVAVGELQGVNPKASRGGMVNVENGGDLKYLVWSQSPETVRLELETLIETAYSMTNTPRITFDSLKGTGGAISGRAFKFAFMGSHMAVENHAEIIGDFFQRRFNFLASAIGDTHPHLKEASQTIDINVEIVPYMIDNLTERITDAINATGGVASLKTGVLLAGLVDEDRVNEEVAKIKEEQAKDREDTRELIMNYND